MKSQIQRVGSSWSMDSSVGGGDAGLGLLDNSDVTMMSSFISVSFMGMATRGGVCGGVGGGWAP